LERCVWARVGRTVVVRLKLRDDGLRVKEGAHDIITKIANHGRVVEGIVPAPVGRTTIVIEEDPLEAFKVLLHHEFTLRDTMLSFNIEARFLQVILALGLVR